MEIKNGIHVSCEKDGRNCVIIRFPGSSSEKMTLCKAVKDGPDQTWSFYFDDGSAAHEDDYKYDESYRVFIFNHDELSHLDPSKLVCDVGGPVPDCVKFITRDSDGFISGHSCEPEFYYKTGDWRCSTDIGSSIGLHLRHADTQIKHVNIEPEVDKQEILDKLTELNEEIERLEAKL